MNRSNLALISVIFVAVGLGCSSMMKGKELADPAVERFHAQFNSGQYNEIYNAADDEFKKNVTPEQWSELMDAVHRKLGTVVKANTTGWHVNTTPSGTVATVSCDVEFSDAKGTEEFVFNISGNDAKLYHYNINSPELITR